MPNSLLIDKQVSARWQNLVIRASAGTGKTYSLSNRFLRLVLAGESIDTILATTFTRQAAREILDRILFRLAKASESDAECHALALAIEAPDIDRKKCVHALADLTSNLHRVRVSTLDAFFVRIAKSFSLELGLPPGWRIIDETEEVFNRERAIGQFLSNDRTQDVIRLMHLMAKGDSQRSIARMIRDTVVDLHSLYCQSDAAAWQKIKRSEFPSDAVVDESLDLLSTFDDLPATLAKAKNEDVARFQFEQWDEFLSKGLTVKIASNELVYRKSEIPTDLVSVYAALIEFAQAAIRNRIANQTEGTFQLLERFDFFYDAQKNASRGLRFQDINTALTTCLRVTNADAFAHRMNGNIDHLLLDEFQDTALEQWQVLLPFAKRITNSANGDRSYFCVGDTKQAIYGWRGGDADILELMDHQLDGLEHQELTLSFRSSPTVIDFVNDINRGLKNHSGLSKAQQAAIQRWTTAYPIHSTAKTEYPGCVTIETADFVDGDSDEKPIDAVLQRTADRIKELAEKAPGISVAVLTRTNAAVAKTIFYLQQLGIPANEVGGSSIDDSAAVQLIISLLHLADHPSDTTCIFHLANSPWGQELGFSQTAHARRALTLSAQVRNELADNGYGYTIHQWARQLRQWCNAREWRRLEQLTELAFKFQQQMERPIQLGYASQQRIRLRTDELIKQIRTIRVADPTTNPVTVMTIHQSKGLQFDAVFVTELDSTRQQTPACMTRRPSTFEPLDWVSRYISKENLPFFPAELTKMHDDLHIEKERENLCVLYVALTRAIYGLHLMISPKAVNAKGKATMATSAAGIILSALNEKPPTDALSTVYEMGNPEWFQQIQAAKECSSKGDDGTTTIPRLDKITLQPGQSGSTGVALSPSTREGSGKVRLRHRLSLRNSEAMRYGTLLHAWFEQIEWLADTAIDRERQTKIAFELGYTKRQAADAVEHFANTVTQPEIVEILTEESYLSSNRVRALGVVPESVSVKNEQAIQAIVDGGLMNGFIDRLVLFFDRSGQPVGADIIDYKTDLIDGESGRTIREKASHYRPQLDAYRDSVCQMLKIAPAMVAACLVFVQTGQVIDIPVQSTR